jgi:hypothetical protein
MPDGPEEAPTPPLKRHAALRPLSREHMSGLVQARNLAAAADAGGAACSLAAADFVRVWRAEIRGHFDDEERLLLPLVRGTELETRLLGDHQELRALAARCEQDPGAFARDPGGVRRLGSLLHDHIRWEERVLFEAVQRDHPEALAALTPAADLMEHARPGSRARKPGAA